MTASGTRYEEAAPIVTYDRQAELPSATFGARWRWSFHSLFCMRSIFAALVLSFSSAVAAQPLRPCVPEVFPEYYRALEDVFSRSVPAASELSIILMPSFSPERAVRLREEEGRFAVYSMELSGSLIQSSIRDIPSVGRTFDFNQPSIQATISQATMPSGLARRVLTVFRDAVAQSEPGRDLVMDGTSYRIEISGRCAEAFSPKPDSESGRVVRLIWALAELSSSEELGAKEIERLLSEGTK